ncbi:expressed unknown protein [Seminavis robusta]|uniref:Palmitoyltransferase n=1 Tax=Seminavis robusta TaxID=568900 RepID=A0A9N8HKE1_9STRA|nr:expressed unknown protein [Seminavis robusta]|eukprot:Sro750_g196940.1 n/a (304) ;mRNA; f:16767-17784
MPRRGAATKATKTSMDSEEDVPLAPKRSNPQKPGSLSLESEASAASEAKVSVEERFENESYNMKVKHWKDSPFAVGLTEVTWADEKLRNGNSNSDDQSLDSANCLCFSSAVCPHVPGVVRVGNMSVLKQSTYSIDAEEEDEETGEIRVVRVIRPKLDIVVGPYWPMLCLVTYPLILGISGWSLLRAVPGKPFYLQLAWLTGTIGLIVSLALTACRDPGIMYRRHAPPKRTQTWRWSDQAQTYRPRGAIYDPDTAVVVEGFDHTCPWTGTAIGRKNMLSFQFFVCLVFVMMVFNILLLTKSLGK